jgi:sulfite dehydrogenase (cytochrome) subunit A
MTQPERNPTRTSPDRRQWLRWAVAAGLAGVTGGCSQRTSETTEGKQEGSPRFPEKVPLRVINDRPPCLETPWNFYRHDLTPNDAFYVRWHLQFLPTTVDLQTWRLRIGGHVERPLEFSLSDLRSLERSSVVAVNQCSGNSRSFFNPPVPGAQWGDGAMGNARWTGVPLRELLKKAGIKAGTVDVTFAGLDRGGFAINPGEPWQTGQSKESTEKFPIVPDFVKALPIDEARRPDILVAYEMNGEPLPFLNGFPVRLVVPGWYATYWMKSLSDIRVVSQQYNGYWMKPAYRIPTTPNAIETPDHLSASTVPINRMNVRSFFVTPESGARLSAARQHDLEGIAFDGGDGIRVVEISLDGGQNWREASLGNDLGRYSFRRWRSSWRPEQRGTHQLLVRATSGSGEIQPLEEGWNRSGYMRNVVEKLTVEVV